MLQSFLKPANLRLHSSAITASHRFYANKSKPASPDAASTEGREIAVARQWLDQMTTETIPRSICDVTFSRSSGPGGQNVNKVNSKATVRVPLHALLPLVPTLLHAPLRSSRYSAAKADALVIQAEDSRKQSDNVTRCFAKLHALIREVGMGVLPGETSAEQMERVKKL